MKPLVDFLHTVYTFGGIFISYSIKISSIVRYVLLSYSYIIEPAELDEDSKLVEINFNNYGFDPQRLTREWLERRMDIYSSL
ncbi:hypothetical protein [Paenibacillus sp. FSL K6-0108]|uniref:hypothetical protein n=1 Tax=Paenibacillus sp. FSL K6-0108 TaxID=2921417 RepID=UPI00325299F2